MTAAERRKLADQVRAAIDESQLSRYEIAKRSGVDEASISRFMNERAGLSFVALEKLAPVIGLEIVVKQRKR
jgi:transcriptional regulator with XRE-family HTH domain